MSEKTCEVVVLRCSIFTNEEGVMLPTTIGPCGELAAYYAKGCPGAVTGNAFVCEEHKNFYSPREITPIDDWWVQQTEALLRG